ncbi:hypothetical protein Tco_1158567 [Tanacetum coccineum]
MEQQMTLLCDIDPMMDDVKVLARCISIWKSHAAGKQKKGTKVQGMIKGTKPTMGFRCCSSRSRESCFYEGWAEKFNDYANQKETTGPVVMILQLARVKYFNDKASVSNCLFFTKLYLNEDISEIVAFKQRCGSKAKLIDSSESKPKTSAQSSSMTSGESSSFAA